MTFRPLHDRVIIKRLKAEEKTASGIVLPGSAAEKPDIGEVIAIGNGKLIENGKRIPLELKVGDRVIFGKYSGQNIKIENNAAHVVQSNIVDDDDYMPDF
jgi:chaperonin GroES